MAKNISLLGADYPGVPAVQLPQTGGGTATFYDIKDVIKTTTVAKTTGTSQYGGFYYNLFSSPIEVSKIISVYVCEPYANKPAFVEVIEHSGEMIIYTSEHSLSVTVRIVYLDL